MSEPLDNVKLGVSGLDGALMLYRHGKDSRVALARREVEGAVMEALVRHMFHDLDDAAKVSKDFTIGDGWYTVTLAKVDKPA